jgi:hypothetical protein
MSWLFVHSVLDDDGLDAESFRVLGHIARRAAAGQAYSAIKSMAQVCRMDKKTVADRLGELTKCGWLIREHRPGMTALYRLPPNPPHGCTHGTGEPTASADPTHGTGGHPTRQTGDEGNPSKDIHEGNPKTRGKRAVGFDATMLELPFLSAEFGKAWGEWCQHLREKKKPLGKSAGEKQLRKLASIGEARALAAIDHSITSNWQGIYEAKVGVDAVATAPQPRERW